MDQQVEEIGWVDQALRGDRAAFGQLMHRYAGAVYNLAYRMLGNAEDAEDASQEIFLRAYTRLASFDRTRKFSTWLLSIGSNYCIDRLRRRRFAWLTLDDAAYALPSAEPGPERSALSHERRERVQQALQRLPENYRLVTVLRYWHDLSYEEIERVTGLPESTIKTRLHRARHMLAAALGPEEQMLWDTETTA
ncbi:MAG TPA: sigma-70 family RNA polymerase sigma factor [Kouleothrix sp.]|uniref:sigma-70 family RNA polymerase sigma factor n=1 Tax=Kouleothrix sp. TaxID=2779161 RepID=UPI002BEC0D4E|nr:sigma-70 family RNA polymerase sigma factor [Kouleothrix sp.]HRC76282.1 sigma-70 family RNA polymerase sigma factor [Kouleothrix sp.]